ncbi:MULTISPECIES: thioredoxin family protein [Chryseobacterium]|uniref:Thioredoxin-related protein n=1 Tax=Chryseobacterium camelliae TaxID=1265445 RepID=A0ABU0TJJ6_9FLAO|nr:MULTISPECIES: thioredoxin family protein [Chryseobacterium]MDT3405816.1 thioredoxin-related protein [Pseudacidovorax intermedius]MDQ1096378.1 thioredoxin-related protein [Chryseobacterium camelliae]MDQ1100317.1 thioredoxin-related protein [Chryseobacterium sp. SORGH_AS_1048]MDR6087660.1 thioredoxin-related protein [Chryseobacterium sp. SORGH_AS_0909]MDR6132034.1 thioredoxin-related protein [Chryseobacterium sp. SORGH_AS_1175]
MKKLSLIAFLSFSVAVFSQKVNGSAENKSKVSNTVTAKADAENEAKMKAAQEKAQLPKPYDAKADAEADIQRLIAKAGKENKNIMIQAGGNWCIWCLRFNNFVQTTPELKKLVDDNYLYYHLNYSPDNKNEKVFSQYGNPGDKFGYPVFIVLDKYGKMIHIQPSDVLEEGKGYSLEKVKAFFQSWTSKS